MNYAIECNYINWQDSSLNMLEGRLYVKVRRKEWLSFFRKSKIKLLDEKFNIDEELKNNNGEQQLLIVKRI